jgi:hypothetical protein
MRKILSLWRWITGSREWLVLLLVAAAAAWLYAEYVSIRRDRDRLHAIATEACAAAGSQLVAASTAKRGQLCLRKVRELAAFKGDTDAESARILAEAVTDHNRKTKADAAHARRSAEAANAAAARMEKADAAIQDDDRVGADWFGAVNDVAGLRPRSR